MKKVTYLSGGVGGARFAYALQQWNLRAGMPCSVSAVVNVGDDFTHLGMRISPDIDSVTYHLANLGDQERGWGRAGDSDSAIREVKQILPEAGWFHLGDLDIAHSLMRTHLLNEGHSLSEVTAKMIASYGVSSRILPVTNDPSPTRVVLPTGNGLTRETGFQQWWVQDNASPLPTEFRFPLAASATPTPDVIDAIEEADVLVIAPSNPVVSIDPILRIPGIRDALMSSTAPIVGISPIIGGKPVRGWADRCLSAVGVECSAAAVANWYGHRSEGGLLDGWLVDPEDIDSARSFPGVVESAPLRFTRGEEDCNIINTMFDLAAECAASLSVNHRFTSRMLDRIAR